MPRAVLKWHEYRRRSSWTHTPAAMMAARQLKNLDWHRRRSFVSLYVNSITTTTTILPLYDSPPAVSLFYIFDLCFSFSLYSCLIFYSFLFLFSIPLSFVHTYTHNIETRDLSFFCFVFPSLSTIEAERNLHRDWLERRCKLHSYWLSSSPSIRWWLREAAAERSIHSAAAGFSYLEPPFTHPPSIDQEEHYGRAGCCVVSFFFSPLPQSRVTPFHSAWRSSAPSSPYTPSIFNSYKRCSIDSLYIYI